MTKKLFALLATLPVATLGAAGLALADADVVVINSNSAYVENEVSSKADTGDNWAGGSTGGAGGTGGSVANVGTGNDANGNTTGNAGNGGNGGIGGTVLTGNAISAAGAENHVNKNRTEVDFCGCESTEEETNDEEGKDVFVKNKNRAAVKNYVRSKADTGDSSADGSMGGAGGSAGGVTNVGDDNDADENTTGAGGNGGTGNAGGLVDTGDATSLSQVLNYINRNVTRITR